jgi:hypothetical protein
MSFEKTSVSSGNKYRLLVESKWDKEKKHSKIHVIKHLGKIAEKDDKETLIPSQLKIITVDKAYPAGELVI